MRQSRRGRLPHDYRHAREGGHPGIHGSVADEHPLLKLSLTTQPSVVNAPCRWYNLATEERV